MYLSAFCVCVCGQHFIFMPIFLMALTTSTSIPNDFASWGVGKCLYGSVNWSVEVCSGMQWRFVLQGFRWLIDCFPQFIVGVGLWIWCEVCVGGVVGFTSKGWRLLFAACLYVTVREWLHYWLLNRVVFFFYTSGSVELMNEVNWAQRQLN